MPLLIDPDAVVSLNDLDGLATQVDEILDVQPVVFPGDHSAGQGHLALPGLRIHMQPLQADVVVLGGIHVRAGGLQAPHQFLAQGVDIPDEVAHELGLGVAVDLVGGADLLDIALVEHRDPVGEGQGLLLVMGDVDGRDAEVLLHLFQLVPELDPELGVQVGQRLVQVITIFPLLQDTTSSREQIIMQAAYKYLMILPA